MNGSMQMGLFERMLTLLTPDVMAVLGFILLGVAWSIGWTQWRKPRIRQRIYARAKGYQQRRLRAEAFWSAVLTTTLLILAFTHADARSTVALIIIAAPLAGFASPVGYDIWRDRILPWLLGRSRKS